MNEIQSIVELIAQNPILLVTFVSLISMLATAKSDLFFSALSAVVFLGSGLRGVMNIVLGMGA